MKEYTLAEIEALDPRLVRRVYISDRNKNFIEYWKVELDGSYLDLSAQWLRTYEIQERSEFLKSIERFHEESMDIIKHRAEQVMMCVNNR